MTKRRLNAFDEQWWVDPAYAAERLACGLTPAPEDDWLERKGAELDKQERRRGVR